MTLTRIREAYLIRNLPFLIKAYHHGRPYLKIAAVEYIGEIGTQKEYEFLLKEMTTVEEERLKSYLYFSIMQLVQRKSVKATDSELEYLRQNADLLKNIGQVRERPKMKSQTPLTLQHKKKDYLRMLEDMKKFFRIH